MKRPKISVLLILVLFLSGTVYALPLEHFIDGRLYYRLEKFGNSNSYTASPNINNPSDLNVDNYVVEIKWNLTLPDDEQGSYFYPSLKDTTLVFKDYSYEKWPYIQDLGNEGYEYEPIKPFRPTPEPGTLALLSIGIGGLAVYRARRRRRSK